MVIVDRTSEDRLSKRLGLQLDMKSNFRMREFVKERVLDDVDRRLLRALQERRIRPVGGLRERVGRGVNVMCQVRMRSHAPADRTAFEAYLATRPDVMEAHSMSGEWDYLLRIVAADVAGYERFLMRDLLNHSNVATAASHFALSQVKYTTAVPL